MARKSASENFTEAEQRALETGDTSALKAEAEQAEPEASVAEEAAPEAPEPAEEAKPKGKSKTVPHEAFHEEREKRKQFEAELTTTRERMAVLEDRWNRMLELQKQPEKAPEQPKAPPRPDENIFGWADHVSKQLEELKGGFGHVQQQTEQQRVVSTLQTAYRQDAERFSAQTPDFQDAYRHLVSQRDAELQALGVADPGQRQAMIEMEELQIVSQAINNKRSPAEIAYALAKARGYAPRSTEPAPQPTQQQQLRSSTNGQFTSVDKIAEAAAKQAAAKSLSAVGGGGGSVEITSAKDVAALSDDEFAAWYNEAKKKGKNPFARIAGMN